MARVTKLLSILFLCVFLICMASAAIAAEDNGLVRRIVVFQDTFANEPAQAALLGAFGGEPLRPLPLVNGMSVLLPPPAVSRLAARGEVVRIDVDAKVHALPKPPWAGGGKPKAQPSEVLPWGVDRIDAEYAWAASTGLGVNVAVIDTGIDRDHPDLADNIAGGVNYVGTARWKPVNPNKWDDGNGHGTHVAGIIAALDNDIGVVGVAPEASLYAVRVLGNSGSGYVSDVVAGLEWAILNDMDICNMSLGTNTSVQSLREACDAAAAYGLLLVAAAGNDGGAVDYPAAYSSVIAVAAVDNSDTRPSWSSYGPSVELAAPGVDVYSTWKGGGYKTIGGTSMAAPHVAGTLALNLSADLCASADDLPPAGVDDYTGCGLVDAGEAATGIPDNGDDLP
jgi:subtilisin family serine protease